MNPPLYLGLALMSLTWIRCTYSKVRQRHSQSASHEASLVLGLGTDIDGLDEVHIQHTALQKSDGLAVLRLQSASWAALPFIGLTQGFKLVAPEHMIR